MGKIYNKNKSLTIYAFKLGYKEWYEDSQDWKNKLIIEFVNSPGLEYKRFRVKGFINNTYHSRVYDKVTDARKFTRRFKKLKRTP